MNRKDYESVATSVADTIIALNLEDDQIRRMEAIFCNDLQLNSDNFDGDKFINFIDWRLAKYADEVLADQNN